MILVFYDFNTYSRVNWVLKIDPTWSEVLDRFPQSLPISHNSYSPLGCNKSEIFAGFCRLLRSPSIGRRTGGLWLESYFHRGKILVFWKCQSCPSSFFINVGVRRSCAFCCQHIVKIRALYKPEGFGHVTQACSVYGELSQSHNLEHSVYCIYGTVQRRKKSISSAQLYSQPVWTELDQ